MFLSTKKFFDATEGGGFAFNPFEGAQAGEIKVITEDTPRSEPVEKVVEEVEAVTEPAAEQKTEEKVEEKVEAVEPEVKEIQEEVKEQPVFNFDEELKKVDKWEVMKKLGLGDFEIDLLKYKEQTGDVTPYLEAKTVDYSKFTDEQMMKYDLRKQYKGMSDKNFDLLYEQKVNEQYKLDADIHGEAAAELGRELLKLEADKIRQRAIEEQAKFKAPERPVDDSAQKQQQEQEAKYNEYKAYVTDSNETKTLLKDKKLVYGNGEAAFNYTVENPNALVDTILNPNLLFNDLVDKSGNVDVKKFYKAKAYIANMDKIEQMLISHGETIGKKKSFDELENPSKKEPAASAPNTEMTFAQALMKHGKFRSGD